MQVTGWISTRHGVAGASAIGSRPSRGAFALRSNHLHRMSTGARAKSSARYNTRRRVRLIGGRKDLDLLVHPVRQVGQVQEGIDPGPAVAPRQRRRGGWRPGSVPGVHPDHPVVQRVERAAPVGSEQLTTYRSGSCRTVADGHSEGLRSQRSGHVFSRLPSVRCVAGVR